MTADFFSPCRRRVKWMVTTLNESVMARGEFWVDGNAEAVWDLRDTKGVRAANGVYLWRFDDGGRKVIRKVMIMK